MWLSPTLLIHGKEIIDLMKVISDIVVKLLDHGSSGFGIIYVYGQDKCGYNVDADLERIDIKIS